MSPQPVPAVAIPLDVVGSRYPESVYLSYLPAVYREDPFLRRFILIFESILAPLERMVDTLPLYTEPDIAPRDFLPWLAHWVALSLDSAWPEESQRALIANAVEIYRWRGTRRGLALHIKCYTGLEPIIQEYGEGFVLGRNAALGYTTNLVSATPDPLLFVVTVPAKNPDTIDLQVLRTIIDEDKPAHATYRVRVVRSAGPRDDDRPPHATHRAHVARGDRPNAPGQVGR
ncbi:MAG TPA: phage tail protein I [Chloroflexota bacterium]|nr:phage tail protein I [Chloroflexota bacterium]